MNTMLGSKVGQTQKFLENGARIPVTVVKVSGNVVVAVKSYEKQGWTSIQLGFGMKKNPTKAASGMNKGAKLTFAPRYFKEAKLADGESAPELGTLLNATEFFKPGDVVSVTGVSKGKGYAGGVKRHHFKGGPRTHGQSDRERAPGSIGQTTTPGRVYKGKRMAGRMGQDNVTVRNLQVIDVTEEQLLIKGLLPGSVTSIVTIEKVGENKKFVPLHQEKPKEEALHQSPSEEVQAALQQPAEAVEEASKKEASSEETKVESQVEKGKEDHPSHKASDGK